MSPARPRKTIKLPWKPAWERERMIWMFFVLDRDASKLRQLLEDLAPHGYRSDGFYKYSPRIGPHVQVLALLAQLTEKQLHTEIMRVQKACDRLGLEGLDVVDVEETAARPLHIN